MAYGFSGGGGGGPEFFGVGGRSMTGGPGNNNSQISPPGIFLDQIGNRVSGIHGIAGKRTLADFQAAQQHQPFHNQAALNAFLLRSVKPRTFQNLPSPISPLPPQTIDLTGVNDMAFLGGSSQRYGLPLLPHLRSQHVHQTQTDLGHQMGIRSVNSTMSNGSCTTDPAQSENMVNSLRELEKQLLDDDDSDALGDDDVSVITNTNSDWSETIQSLVKPNPVSPSSSSSSSTSSSPSTTSTMPVCTRQTIMEVATAIAEGKTDIASEILTRISQSPNPKRNSEQKLVELMAAALRSRLNPAENSTPVSELYGKDHLRSTQLLYELSPCFKLGFMAANLAILESTLDATSNNALHVIDFDIGKGGQYENLLHALSTRHSGKKPPVVKITAVANKIDGYMVADGNEERLKTVGDMLSQLGNRLGITLKFNVVTTLRLSDLSRESLGCDPDEPLAVNLAFKLYRVPDESVCIENPRDELLRRVKGLKPRVVTLVEQEMNSNTAPFLGRVSESCACYGALLDSVESTVPSSNSDRSKVEEGIGRKLANVVACEGLDRIERCEVFGKWRMRMSMAGFELMTVSEKIAESMKSRLSNGNRVHSGFTVKEENGGVCFGWMGRTLAVASAWR